MESIKVRSTVLAQKVFLTKSGMANFFCPECGTARHMDVSKYRSIGKEVRLKVTCSCGHKYSAVLERRQYVRKKVLLKGKVRQKGRDYHVDVINISRYGLRIKSNGPLDLNPQEKVILEFQLDDTGQSIVKKEIIIRTVQKPEFGAEFVEKNHYDKLGTYLLFHFS